MGVAPSSVSAAVGEFNSDSWLFQNSRELLAVVGPTGRFKKINPAWTKTTDWTDEDLIGRICLGVIHPEDRAAVAQIASPGNLEGLVETEMRLKLKSGGYRWHQGYFQRADTGDMIGVLRDISAEHDRKAEQANAQRTRELLAESAGIGQWEYEPLTDRRVWSPEFMTMTGYAPEEVISHEQFNTIVHPDDLEAMDKAFARGVIKGVEGSVDHRIRTKDGRWIRVRATFRTEPRAGGLYALKGISQDITELAEARDAAVRGAHEVSLALAQAEAASEAKATFLANMSHEIRTPMNGVLGVLHLLQQESLSPGGQSLLTEALACGQMLSQLLNDVLDFSKIEAGKLEIANEPLSPRQLVEGVASLIRPQADAKGLELIVDAAGAPEWVMSDPVRLRQALFNLIGNAVKFTLHGHVSVHVRGDGERLRFDVEDTGVGISAEAQERLFQRFSQADASTTRRFGGSGLGLAITHKLAELMGGDVGVTSKSGVGSTFWLEIAAPATEAPRAMAALQGAVLDGLNILLVEDNATNRLIATKLLENLGASVESAVDGESGVEAARLGAFDLILMDIQMPGIDGMEAARRIRALDGPAAHLPIVALTANVLTHQRADYLAAGMNGVVGKPISPGELLAEVARLAGGDEAEEVAA